MKNPLYEEIDRLRAENKQLNALFSNFDDPEIAQTVFRGKFVIMRVTDYDALLKLYYDARDRAKEGEG